MVKGDPNYLVSDADSCIRSGERYLVFARQGLRGIYFVVHDAIFSADDCCQLVGSGVAVATSQSGQLNPRTCDVIGTKDDHSLNRLPSRREVWVR